MSKPIKILIPILFLGILTGVNSLTRTPPSLPDLPGARNASLEPLASGCSVFTVAKGEQVFFGGNDDSTKSDSYYWVDPGDEQKYGAIWIGMPDNVQQGINEAGLAYDANGLPRLDTKPHPEREAVIGSYTSYPIHILHECATVEEVIEWVNTHRWHTYMHDQMHFADASGDAVIISAGTDGEVVFTRKPPGDGFLVSTNFNVANPSNGWYPCKRYDTATEQLGELVNQDGALIPQDAAAVLEAISSSGGSSWTIESLVADLTNGTVYLYYFRQFDQPVVLNVAEEIAANRRGGPLSALFPEEVRQEAARSYQRILNNQGLCEQVGKAWAVLELASLVLILLFLARRGRILWYWLMVVLILGPLGLLAWLIAGRKQEARGWQVAVLESTGHLPPLVLTFMVLVVVSILAPQAQANDLLLILFIFVLPLLMGWVIYQAPLLARAARCSYFRMLGQRLPAAWVATNLGMAGVFVLSIRLIDWISYTCVMIEPSAWALLSLWVAVVVSAGLGLLLILVYESWAVRRGWRAWSVLALGQGEVATPSWREAWGWLLISFGVLIGGILVNALLS